MASEKRIEALVARVIAPHDVALNVGSAKGVRTGDKAVLYDKYDVDDPVSHERLGGVIYTRLRLEISFVSEKFSIGRVTEKYQPPSTTVPLLPTMVPAPAARLYEVTQSSSAGPGEVKVMPGDKAYITLTPDPTAPVKAVTKARAVVRKPASPGSGQADTKK